MPVETHKVFVSHAGEDKERFVLDFAKRLRDQGIDAWIDAWEMLPGDILVDKIFNELIMNASSMIFVISKKSINKQWVREELNAGFLRRLRGSCKLIPVVIDECEIPEALLSTVWQRIPDLDNYSEEFQRILDSIYGRTQKPPLGPPAAQLRRDRLRDDLNSDRGAALDTAEGQQDLEGLILDKSEAPLLRLRALDQYLNFENRSGSILIGLITDPDSQVRRNVLLSLHKNPIIDILNLLDIHKIKKILEDPDDHVAVAAARLACDLVKLAIVPAEIMASLSMHSYWLVRSIAIGCVINSGNKRTIEILYEFKETSYHVSQQMIRDYVENQYMSLKDHQKELALDLLRGMMKASKVSRISNSKTERLIEALVLKQR